MRLKAPRQPISPQSPHPSAVQASGNERRSISRRVYLGILLVLAVLLLRLVVGALLITEVGGVVEVGAFAVCCDRAGVVTEILVEPGAAVAANQVLARLEVPAERDAARIAATSVVRLTAQLAGERQRAAARASKQASRDSAEAARLRDRALAARAELGEIEAQLSSTAAQLKEVVSDLDGFEQLTRVQALSRTAYLELRLQRVSLEGRAAGMRQRQIWVEQKADNAEAEAARLDRRVATAQDEAEIDSQVESLKAQLAEARSLAELHREFSRRTVIASRAGIVSWVLLEAGEFATAGAPILHLVPAGPATVIAWPGDAIDTFPVGTHTRVQGPGFTATGTVTTTFAMDRSHPAALLAPYQREVVGPAVVIELDAVDGTIRADAIVEVRTAATRFLHYLF